MAASDELVALNRAFSGLGIDEKVLIAVLGKYHPEQRRSFRKGTRDFFIDDERQFERWNDLHIIQLQQEFMRFKQAIVLWTMHPWERDARLLKEFAQKGSQHDVLIELACTRTAEELLGARRAYHSLFDHSVEEEVAFGIPGPERKLLVALLSSFRYEGPKVNDEIAKSEAKFLSNAIKGAAGKRNMIENEEVVTILATRSKLHIIAVYKHYKEISGNYLDEDLDGEPYLQVAVQCLCKPQAYFSKILDASLRPNADEVKKDSVTRIIATRADIDMKHIKEEYARKYGVSLPKKIEEVAKGNYRDFLLTLLARGD